MTRGLAQSITLGSQGASRTECVGSYADSPKANPPGDPENKVIGVICAGDCAVHRDEVKNALERGTAQRQDAVWVCVEPKSDRMTHDVMMSLDMRPVVLPLIDPWRVQRSVLDWHSVWSGPDPDAWPKKRVKTTLYDGRRTWRDLELLNCCDELIVFHKRTSSSPWRDRAASGLYKGRLFVVELGPEPVKKARKTRKPVGVA